MSNRFFNKSSVKSEKYTVQETLVNYFLALMFALFPLFFTNAYFNIRHDKYDLFIGLSLFLLLSEGGLFAYVKLNEQNKKTSVTDESQEWYKKLSVPDFAMLGFLFFSFVSTAFSQHVFDALLGTAGRNNGLLLTALYVGIYFVITRIFNYREYIFIVLAIASSLVYLLAILNCFYIDPLGMFAELTDKQTITDFTSTIGNKNLMSSYICVTLPALMSLAVITEKNLHRALYLVASGFGFASLMTSDSDSGILGIGVFCVIYFIWFTRRIVRLKRYMLTITTMLIFAKLLRLFSLLMNDKSKGLDQFQNIFVYSNISYVLIGIFAVLTALLYFIDYKNPDVVLPKAVPVALIFVFALCFIVLVGAMVYFSVFDTTTKLGSFEKLLRFNDKWGTHRGYMWIRSMWIFNDSSIFEKLFGNGPDNFYYAFMPYFEGLKKFGDGSTNAAHNEYINYLITIGITGTLAYLTAVFGVFARAVKYAHRNPLIIVCVAGVICYSVQAVVNITQPITTPLFIIMLALTEAFVRKAAKNK